MLYPVSDKAKQFIKNHNLQYRELTTEEKEKADTDAKRNADYLIIYDGFNHHEYYWNGKLNDLYAIWHCIERW